MSAQEQMRKMLDELMGTSRNGENSGRFRFTDPKVCRSFLLNCCPHDILASTRADLGACAKHHDPALRADYEQAAKNKDYGYHIDATQHLQSFIADCDRRTENSKKRLLETQESLSAEVNHKADNVHEMAEMLGKKIAEAEKHGEEGDVEKSIEVMAEVEEIRQKKIAAEDQLRNSMPASTYQQQKLRVCEVCGAYLGLQDNDRRLADHFGGKLHLGFIEIREKLQWLLNYSEQQREQRRMDRERDVVDDDSKGSSKESYRDRRDKGDRERGDRDRGDRDRGDRERGDKDRGDKDRGDKDRGDKDRGDKDRGDKDRGDKDRGDKDRGDKDRGDKDRGDKDRDRERGDRDKERERDRGDSYRSRDRGDRDRDRERERDRRRSRSGSRSKSRRHRRSRSTEKKRSRSRSRDRDRRSNRSRDGDRDRKRRSRSRDHDRDRHRERRRSRSRERSRHSRSHSHESGETKEESVKEETKGSEDYEEGEMRQDDYEKKVKIDRMSSPEDGEDREGLEEEKVNEPEEVKEEAEEVPAF